MTEEDKTGQDKIGLIRTVQDKTGQDIMGLERTEYYMTR